MAKNRMINTKFWDDSYTSNLDPIEKLLFLYFLTNTSTTICGIYEIPLKKIANETGVDKDMVDKVLQRFEKDNKMFYREGWLGMKNFIKNQNQKSPKVKKGIEIEMEKVPKIIKNLVLGKGIDTLSHSNSNSNSNLTQLDTPAKAGIKSMKNYKDTEIDYETGELNRPKPPMRQKAINYIKDYFLIKCEKKIGIKPIMGFKQNIVIANLFKKGFKPSELKEVIDWWFDTQKDKAMIVQINTCLSAYYLTNYQVMTGKKLNETK